MPDYAAQYKALKDAKRAAQKAKGTSAAGKGKKVANVGSATQDCDEAGRPSPSSEFTLLHAYPRPETR